MKKHVFMILIFLLWVQFGYSANIYKTSAIASYYAGDFHGKQTSNGEIFNMWALTCAHKMLPFNTILKVTNLANGKSVQVRVNDRGPFVKSREIDLSKGAASKIGMIGTGIAKVRIEIIKLGKYTKDSVVTGKKACQMAGIQYKQVKLKKSNPNVESVQSVVTKLNDSSSNLNIAGSKKNDEDSKAKEKELQANQKKSKVNITDSNINESEVKTDVVDKDVNQKYNKRIDRWDIQLGAFSSRENAINFGKKIKKKGFENVVLQTTSKVIRVVLKDIGTDEVESYIQRLTNAGYTEYSIKPRK